MERFARFTVARDAFVAALAGMVLIACSFDPPLALVIGASVAMAYTVLMLVRARYLTEEKVAAAPSWPELQPEEPPAGDLGPAFARDRRTAMLGAAKNAAGIASALFAIGLFLNLA